MVKGQSEFTRRRLRIRKEDLETFGYTTGCPGCRAVNGGTTATNHSEDRRKRLIEELEKVGDERLDRETGRLFEYMDEEEENKKKKAKTAERSGESEASASSRGPAAREGEVPRSRGGVPTTADSGDSAPDGLKTNWTR